MVFSSRPDHVNQCNKLFRKYSLFNKPQSHWVLYLANHNSTVALIKTLFLRFTFRSYFITLTCYFQCQIIIALFIHIKRIYRRVHSFNDYKHSSYAECNCLRVACPRVVLCALHTFSSCHCPRKCFSITSPPVRI